MEEVAATTSSRPALGFASSTATKRSYQGAGCFGPGAGCDVGVCTKHQYPGTEHQSPGLLRNLGRHLFVTRELLKDREEPRVEEPDLEQHEERHRAVDLVDEGVEHRAGEIQAQGQLDERLHADR